MGLEAFFVTRVDWFKHGGDSLREWRCCDYRFLFSGKRSILRLERFESPDFLEIEEENCRILKRTSQDYGLSQEGRRWQSEPRVSSQPSSVDVSNPIALHYRNGKKDLNITATVIIN